MHILFTYGTLKKGCSRSSVLDSSRFIGVAKTALNYELYDCGTYPALVSTPQRTTVATEDNGCTANRSGGVWGELYEVDDPVMSRLDQIEGVDVGLYRREIVDLSYFSLVNLPLSPGAVDFVEKKATIAYVYLHDVSSLEKCGSVWSP
jgi:gamma-glutamylcyclotransferase (GGCT)/AIG2-like uncharacterized protein YtfP